MKVRSYISTAGGYAGFVLLDDTVATRFFKRGGRGRYDLVPCTSTDPDRLVWAPSVGREVPYSVYIGLPSVTVPPAYYLSPGLTNTGELMLFSWTAPASGNPVAIERTWGVAREWKQLSANLPNGQTSYGDKVYDLLHPYYRAVELKPDGTRVVFANWDGVQPPRTNWVTQQTVTTNNTTLQDLNIRVTTVHNVQSNGNLSLAAAPAVKVNTNVTGTVLRRLFMATTGDAVSVGFHGTLDMQLCQGHQLHPGVTNSGPGKFMIASQPTSIICKNNAQNGWNFGYYVDGGSSQDLQTLTLIANRGYDLLNARTNGAVTDYPLGMTGYLMDADQSNRYGPIGHFIQINNCFRIASCEIAWNEFWGEAGFSSGEDAVSWHCSSGISTNWANIHDNMVRNMVCRAPATGGMTGCAYICDGVSPTSDPTLHGYVMFINNVALDFDNVGMGLYYGSNVKAHGNRLLSTGRTFDGAGMYAVNVALAHYKAPDEIAAGFKNQDVTGNYLACWRPLGNAGQFTPGGDSPAYISVNAVDSNATYSNQFYIDPRPATPAMIQAEYKSWRDRLSTAGVVVGAYAA